MKILTDKDRIKIQELEMDMLAVVDELCRKHGIKYSVAYGTMIGAVRHKGFIPWDDDIDIFMLRDDYDKFAEICEKELPDNLFYQSNATDKEYYYSFNKIRLNGTVFKETYLAKYNIHHGVYIDIFPLDIAPDNYILRKLHYMYYLILRVGLNSKYLDINARHGKKKMFARIFRILFAPISLDWLYNRIDKIVQKYDKTDNKTVCCYCGFIGNKDYFLVSDTNEIEDMCLNSGQIVMIYKNYDKILTNQYGDYMQLPSVENRRTVHDLVDYRF